MKKYRNYKTITTILKPFDTFFIIATTSTSITLSLTGFGLTVIPVSTESTCVLSIGSKETWEIVMENFNKNKKRFEKDEHTTKASDNLYMKSLQDNVFDENEYELLCNTFTKYLDETKNESFL